MRKIVVSMFLTLDGVMEAPDQWSLQYWSDEAGTFKNEELFASDALLLGRVTYQGFAAAWPTMKDTGDFGDRMNGIPKYVVSTTLKTADWNNSHIISANVVEEITKLKQQPGQDILVGGSSDLVQTLIKHDLIDVYRLLVYPLIRGIGKHLFQAGAQASLKLVEAKALPAGVVAMIYEPERNG